MLKTIKLTNLLSFGTETEISFNKGLNVLIGTNGSGKSNLIEAISLLQAMPKSKGLTKVIREGGGIKEWLWKANKNPVASIEATIVKPKRRIPLRHLIQFNGDHGFIEIVNETIDGFNPNPKEKGKEFSWYELDFSNEPDSLANIVRQNESKPKYFTEQLTGISPRQSILAQRQDPEFYPVLTFLGNVYEQIQLYREWHFGRCTPARIHQPADASNEFLEEDASNLGLMLNKLRRSSETKKKLLEALQLFNESIDDFDVTIENGAVQVFFHENGLTIPSVRLSDGTLRYLSLLVILLHPNPPPLICIEEPELGLHPDILPSLIDLLKEAAEKTQIIITTHSADLIDDLSDMPEAVLVFDKVQGSTTVNRLNKDELSDWLEDYKLGQLWRRGHLGGNRW